MSGRVMTYGVQSFIGGAPRLDGSQNTITVQVPGLATQSLLARPAEAPVGAQVELTGSDLFGDATEVLLQHFGWPDRAQADPTWGVIAADIDWSLIRMGALIGVGIILLDAVLARGTKHMRVPPLAVGLGIYLPTASTLMIVVGAIVGWFFDRAADRTPKPESTKQLGVLLASGLIVGESTIGVVISAIVVFSGVAAPLALVSAGFETAAIIIGGVAFAATAFVLYRWILGMAARRSA
jgi:hypothetical protein